MTIPEHPNFIGYLTRPDYTPGTGIPVYQDPFTGGLTLTAPEVAE